MGVVSHSYDVLVGQNGGGDWQACGTKPGAVGCMFGDSRALMIAR